MTRRPSGLHANHTMACPKCHKPTFVENSSYHRTTNRIFRWRICEDGHKTTTYEVLSQYLDKLEHNNPDQRDKGVEFP